MKKILITLGVLLSLTLGVFAQTNGSFKSVRFYNVPDSSEFLATTWANFISQYPTSGGFYYNQQSDKFRVYQNGAWGDLGGGGGGDMFLSLAQTSTGKKTFAPDATNPGINIGSFAGNPSAPIEGDMWRNSTSGNINVRNISATLSLVGFNILAGDYTAGRVPVVYNTNGRLASFSGLTATATVLTVPRLLSVSTATLPGVNVGSFAGDPSTLVNGDNWYNSTLNQFRSRKNGITYDNVTTLNGYANTLVPFFDGNSNLAGTNVFTWNTTGSSAYVRTNNILTGRIPLAYTSGGLSDGIIPISYNVGMNVYGPSGTVTNNSPTGSLLLSGGIAYQDAGNGNGSKVTIAGGLGAGSGITGDIELNNNNDNIGKGGHIVIKENTSALAGVATLVGGTVTVNTDLVGANTRILYSIQTAGGTQGFLRVASRVNGTSFTLTSTSATETSTVYWFLVEPN